MDRTPTRANALLGAAALFCMLVVPIAVAGAAGESSGPEATASASVKKNVKKLKKQVKALNQRLAALEGEQGNSRPPSGPGGGDLTGDYPNPDIGPRVVGANEVGLDALTGDNIDESSLGTVPTASEASNAGTLDSLDSTAFGNGITSMSYNPNEAATEFLPGLGTSFGPGSATESSVDLMTAQAPIIARNLRVQVNSLPGPAALWTVRLRDDGQDTGLSCPIVGAIFTTICTDAGPSSTIAVGSRLSLEVTPSGPPGATSVMDIAFRYGPS